MSPRKYPTTSIERHDAAKARKGTRIATTEIRTERLRAELASEEPAPWRRCTAQPQIRLTAGDHEHYRQVHAELLMLAAAVELASVPTREGWHVRVQMDGDFAGRVVIELLDGDAAEADRAMAILNEVVRKAHLAQGKAVPA